MFLCVFICVRWQETESEINEYNTIRLTLSLSHTFSLFLPLCPALNPPCRYDIHQVPQCACEAFNLPDAQLEQNVVHESHHWDLPAYTHIKAGVTLDYNCIIILTVEMWGLSNLSNQPILFLHLCIISLWHLFTHQETEKISKWPHWAIRRLITALNDFPQS